MFVLIDGVSLTSEQLLGFSTDIGYDDTFHTTSTPNRPQPAEFLKSVRNVRETNVHSISMDMEVVECE